MPILDIELIASDTTEGLPANLIQSLADAAAQVFEVGPGRVWVKLRMLPSSHYAENGELPEGMQPVFVTVLKSRVPEGNALEDEVTRLTKTIARVLNHPKNNVHIFYEPDGAGRVAFGGKLVK
jgi:phenylpyruvate tautomerase PptA (4-oxalocrotonate tautomerase family)